jgi:myo-inositol-1(or 4)-monophosphatase
MSVINQDSITAIQQILHQAGQIALQGRHSAQISYKADHTPFTDIELAMEKLIISYLHVHFPGDQIITEENGINGAATERVWLLDPIDGTKVYLNGLPVWGISLGLLINGLPSLGFFYMPKTDELYWGGSGFGAFLNTEKLSHPPNPAFENPLAFLAIPTNAHRYFNIDFPRLRALGSTAAHLCYLVQGAAIGVLTRRVNLWDVAGVLPILSESGLSVTYLSGKSFDPQSYLEGQKFPEELLAAHPNHLELLRTKIGRKQA